MIGVTFIYRIEGGYSTLFAKTFLNFGDLYLLNEERVGEVLLRRRPCSRRRADILWRTI